MNFYPGEPDDLGTGEDCMQIVGGRQDYTGAWDDGNCSKQQDFICEKQACEYITIIRKITGHPDPKKDNVV